MLGGCTFTRTAEVPRADALHVTPHVVVTDEAGTEHEAEVLSVEPIAAPSELPTYYPEAGRAPLFARAATQQEIAAAWERDPSWASFAPTGSSSSLSKASGATARARSCSSRTIFWHA